MQIGGVNFTMMPHGVIDKELQHLGDDALAKLLEDYMCKIESKGSDTSTEFFTIMACTRVLEGRGRLDLIKKACHRGDDDDGFQQFKKGLQWEGDDNPSDSDDDLPF